MPPRKAAKPRQTASDSDSDSSEGSRGQLDASLYASLELAAALRRPADYPTAAAELAALLRELYGSGRCTKQVQAAMVEDAALAIDCCDGRLQGRVVLAALMEAAERHLPQAKRNALLRQYKRSSVQLRRRERRQQGGGGGGRSGAGAGAGGWSDAEEGEEEGGEEEEAPATFSALPVDVIEQVFRYLDPITLARAACVTREWQAAACNEALWQPHCACISSGKPEGVVPCSRGGSSGSKASQASSPQMPLVPQAGRSGRAGGGGGAGWRQQFAAVVAQQPERLLPWRTNRVLAGRRLAWLVPGQQRASRYRHVSTAAVLAYCRSGGRHAGSASSSSASSSGSESEGEHGGGLSRRLRFWQF